MSIHKTENVFVPGGMPRLTYIERSERGLAERLRQANDNLCKLVTVTGATKSGKTVLVGRVFPRPENVWVDGGTVSTEDDLWNAILEQLDGFTSTEVRTSSAVLSQVEGTARTGLAFGLKAEVETTANLQQDRGRSEKRARSMSPRTAAILQLRQHRRALIIDDFHYLPRQEQGKIIRALKPLIFDGSPVILIAIPHRRYDAVKVEREMTGRIEPISIPAWEAKELLEIPQVGFSLLNVDVADMLSRRLAAEAFGSPYLMQEFCRESSYANGIKETLATRMQLPMIDDALFKKVAEGTGRVIFDKLARGPRQRSDRLQRRLKNGEMADIYRVTLYGLARMKRGLATIEYTELRAAIREVLEDRPPQAHEVSRVLEKMGEIASKDESSTPVLDWEKDDQKLHITDPFFAFYLAWGLSGPN